MRIAQINVVSSLSTGRIAVQLCRLANEAGHKTLLCHSRDHAPSDISSYRVGSREHRLVRWMADRLCSRRFFLWRSTGALLRKLSSSSIGCKLNTYTHLALARLTDRAGFFSRGATRRLVKQLRAFQPDLIHLHNLHGYYLHLPKLFKYLKETDIPVVWTLHDCWAYTGHCAYYTLAKNAPPIEAKRRRAKQETVGCDRWTAGCGQCVLKRSYPMSLFRDQSARNWKEKRELFCGLPHMVITTPSEWLRDEVKRSFLKNYPVYALPNGVDLNVFRAFADGFLSQTAGTLTDTEVDTLALSCFVLTAELATRFLADYLDGDLYFNTKYPGHNLVRARCQIALAKDMLNKMPQMEAIVRECIEKFK